MVGTHLIDKDCESIRSRAGTEMWPNSLRGMLLDEFSGSNRMEWMRQL